MSEAEAAAARVLDDSDEDSDGTVGDESSASSPRFRPHPAAVSEEVLMPLEMAAKKARVAGSTAQQVMHRQSMPGSGRHDRPSSL